MGIAQLKREVLISVQPIAPEFCLNEHAYLILCEIRDGKREDKPPDSAEEGKSLRAPERPISMKKEWLEISIDDWKPDDVTESNDLAAIRRLVWQKII